MEGSHRALGAAALALLILGAHACGARMTEPDTEPDTAVCLWVDGSLHCLE